ncbi:MAG: hypothetical protein ACOVOI_03720 [Hyphomicrobiales bacterium]|jgi:hypothetical protein
MPTRSFKRMERPSTISRVPPRSRTQAATELARLEFERERLLRELAVLEARRTVAESSLAKTEIRASQLHGLLGEYATKPHPEGVR